MRLCKGKVFSMESLKLLLYWEHPEVTCSCSLMGPDSSCPTPVRGAGSKAGRSHQHRGTSPRVNQLGHNSISAHVFQFKSCPQLWRKFGCKLGLPTCDTTQRRQVCRENRWKPGSVMASCPVGSVLLSGLMASSVGDT